MQLSSLGQVLDLVLQDSHERGEVWWRDRGLALTASNHSEEYKGHLVSISLCRYRIQLFDIHFVYSVTPGISY